MVQSVADVKAKVLATHADNPQRRGLAEIHLDELERALAGLAALGDNIGLEFGVSPPAVQFPKMLYHAKELQPRIVDNSDEEKTARAAGWNEFPGGVPPADAGVKMPGVANPPVPPAPPPTTKVSMPAAAHPTGPLTKGG
jgi:hypothetical protein